MSNASFQLPPLQHQPDQLLGLYIHWPFCLAKCPYCDFNSHVRPSIDQKAFREALLKEMATLAAWIGPRPIKSIFFGGGTPSLMEPRTAAEILTTAKQLWDIPDCLEVTLEANPTSSNAVLFRQFVDAGVTRFSLGIQSLDDQALGFLGRHHTAQHALEALDAVLSLGKRASADMIYGRPDQSLDQWEQELCHLLRKGLQHVSLYELTYEPGTPFYRRYQRGELLYPEEETQLSFRRVTQQICTAYGLQRYEVSNYAAQGQECIHNVGYWTGQDYLGIGPGAHSRLRQGTQVYGLETHRVPEVWQDHISHTGHGISHVENISWDNQLTEYLMMGLRLERGISTPHFTQSLGMTPQELWGADTFQALSPWVVYNDQQFKLTHKGQDCLNSVVKTLLNYKHTTKKHFV